MTDAVYFNYGERELEHLKSRDPLLAAAIEQIGPIERAVIPDLFEALINAIIGQQISTKAQVTIWERFLRAFDPIVPEHIAIVPVEELQTCGITMRKAGYISRVARTIADGTLDLQELEGMDDGEVCERLSRIDGIGVWTAEMLMMFSMRRPDILSWGDLAIHKGLRMLYHHRKITPQLFRKYRNRYSPYGSVASLYLWEIAHGAIPGMKDYAPKAPKAKAVSKKK